VPDFIANAGGVICAAMEYAGATRAAAFQAIEEKIRANTEAVLAAAEQQRIRPARRRSRSPRTGARGDGDAAVSDHVGAARTPAPIGFRRAFAASGRK